MNKLDFFKMRHAGLLNNFVVAGKLTEAENKVSELEDRLKRLEKAHIALAKHVKRMDNENIVEQTKTISSDTLGEFEVDMSQIIGGFANAIDPPIPAEWEIDSKESPNEG